MRVLTKEAMTLLMLAALSTYCGKEDDDDDDTTTESDMTVKNEVAAFDFLDAAMGTAAPGTLALSTSSLMLESSQSKENKYCSNHGDAWDPDKSSMMGYSVAGAAAQTFYCKLAINSGDPESPRGAYSTGKGIICAISKALNGEIAYEDGDGTEKTLKVKIDGNCFNEGLYNDDGKSPDGFETELTYKAVNLDVAATGWNKKITLVGEPATDAGKTADYLFRFSDGIVAVANESWSMAIDVAAGELRFEMASTTMGKNENKDNEGSSLADSNPAESLFHMRLYAKGKVDADTGAVTDHTDIQGVFYSAVGLASIKGTASDGFKTHGWEMRSNGLDATVTSHCVGASSCAADGFGSDASAYSSFLESAKWETNFTGYKPLSFAEVELKASQQ